MKSLELHTLCEMIQNAAEMSEIEGRLSEHESVTSPAGNVATLAVVRPRDDNNSESDTGLYLRKDLFCFCHSLLTCLFPFDDVL